MRYDQKKKKKKSNNNPIKAWVWFFKPQINMDVVFMLSRLIKEDLGYVARSANAILKL